MLIKIHKSYRQVVAICDSELIGQKIEEGKKQLDVRENFFKGDEIQEAELIEKMQDYAQDDSIFNIIGEKSVRCALKAGIISKEGILKVNGVPYALVLL